MCGRENRQHPGPRAPSIPRMAYLFRSSPGPPRAFAHPIQLESSDSLRQHLFEPSQSVGLAHDDEMVASTDLGIRRRIESHLARGFSNGENDDPEFSLRLHIGKG